MQALTFFWYAEALFRAEDKFSLHDLLFALYKIGSNKESYWKKDNLSLNLGGTIRYVQAGASSY